MRSSWMWCLGLVVLVGCGITYERQVGENGKREPAESISFENRDYGDLARLFVEEFKKSAVYQDELGPHPFPRSLDGLRALATLRGATAHCEAAEAFVTLREVVR